MNEQIPSHLKKPKPRSTSEILSEAAKTFEERNAEYKDNWRMVGPIMETLFPNGTRLNDSDDYELWHLFELMIVKITRLAATNLQHKDSLRDISVYAALIESIIEEREINNEQNTRHRT